MQIKVFTTGGTIDGLEYDLEDQAPVDKQSLIPIVLKDLGLDDQYSITALMNKDSRFVNDDDRALMAQNCRKCAEDKIVITHGTITMVETARYLQAQNLGKTIILTGAMIPADQKETDAPVNVKLAFEQVQTLPAGVYVSMSGRIFEANNVRKNIEKGIFEELN